MRKILLFLILFLVILWSSSKATPIYGDGTGIPRDTIWIDFTTFDTLGYCADSDSFFVRRLWHGAVVDSTGGDATTNKLGTGYYSLPKRAFDGTHYGQYSVEIGWYKWSKLFKKVSNYVVVKGGIDSTSVVLAGVTHTGATIPTVTTVGTTTNLTNWDKAGYSLSASGIDAIWDEVQAGHTSITVNPS